MNEARPERGRPDALRATLLTIGLFLAGLASGAGVASVAADRTGDPYGSIDTLVRVMGLIERTYVDEVSTDTLVQGAIQGMVAKLDPHSVWMSADVWRSLQQETHGSYTGVGVEVQLTADGARVVRVLPNSPASRDGLAVGDLILAVDGHRLESADLSAAQGALLGPRGEKAELQVLREGWDGPRTLSTVRDEIRTPAVRVEPLDDGVVYARMSQFQDGAADELRSALDPLASAGRMRALVLDLRNNPGGLLREAVETADLFLDAGTIVSTWGRMPGEKETYAASQGSYDARVVVLVNGLSASAAEIVAAALQDTKRAQLVGARTYGKGSVQTIFEHRDGSALKLTIGRYYTPSGEPVAPRDGRVPDLAVPMPDDTAPAVRLREALASADLDDATRGQLMTIVDELPDAEIRRLRDDDPRPARERLADDPQLAAAIALAGTH